MPTRPHVVVIGGGAAGVFGAIACAEANPRVQVTVLEKAPVFLAKVRISGGGRCNVTHACFDPRELARRYPRGGAALIGPLHRFQPRDTVAWFEARGVSLKTEPDGRMFPVSDRGQTILDCLLGAARSAGIVLRPSTEVATIVPRPRGGFEVVDVPGERWVADRLLLAAGGCRTPAAGRLAVSLGHALEPPVPSLFTFQVAEGWVRGLAGVAVPEVEVEVPDTALRERGPLLLTHWGVSGPVVLRLSAWGARVLHAREYRFPLRVNWLPGLGEGTFQALLDQRRQQQGAAQMVNTPLAGLPARIWEQLCLAAQLPRNLRWADLSRARALQLRLQLTRTVLNVTGKSLNKDEFVTCGGVRLDEVHFKTLESRICPGLHLAGEHLDIDGITGGFNFQAAWTTGWIAGRAMAEALAVR